MHTPLPRRIAGQFTLLSACGIVLCASLGGCESLTIDRRSTSGAGKGSDFFALTNDSPPPLVDMASPPPDAAVDLGPSCKAAEGLPGFRLLCVDFDGPTAPELDGWTLEVGSGTGCQGWEVGTVAMPELKERAFQLKNFAGVGGGSAECGFTMKPIPIEPIPPSQPYKTITLSVEQWVDLNISDGNQKSQVAEIFPGPVRGTAWLGASTGQVKSWQRWTSRIPRADLASAMFQPLFNLRALTGVGPSYGGWRIKSIAVLGEK